ncbi:tumor necrosis factor ligand superfamily member 10-like [Denticeps clupeoides]|uniref:Tumor necrosis factor ligand superfamily member 10 n=1 Tax=Denticeps clupeoides TaxID=299321 RepID=A0AAY4D948_9TELE|nr:tumor necrosis factor ligand superfamily member 10-like [Denticeps clupeoides]
MDPPGRAEGPGAAGMKRTGVSRTWISLLGSVLVVLQVASTGGLLLYLNQAVMQVRTQTVTEEMRCLGLLNALERDQELPDALVHIFGEPCIKLAEGIKAYITKVTENILSKHSIPEPREQPRMTFLSTPGQRASAHLTLRDTGLQDPASQVPQPDLHQSCRHPVVSWGNHSFGSHLRNLTLSNGRLRVPRPGRYYLYAQVYFRDPRDAASSSHQVVQCVYKKTAYARPIQLLKGVGTKCWAPESEHALHSIYQGGLFELRAGDEIFVSVSTPAAVHAEDSSSYFGLFRFDL